MNSNKNNKSGGKLPELFRKSVLVFFVLVLTSCSLLPESLTSRFSGSRIDETPVRSEILVPVVRGNIASSLSFVGNLQYNQSAELTWKTGGVIDSVNVKVGDKVKKGDILAVLATDSLISSVIIAEKNMIDQQEKLDDVKHSESAYMDAYSNLNSKEAALIQAKLEQEALYYPRSTRQDMELAWDTLALAHLNFNYAKQDYDYLVSINESWEGNEPPRTVQTFGGKKRIGGDSRSGRERKFEEYLSAYNTYVSAYENYLWVSGQPDDVDYAIAEGNVQVAQLEYDKALEEYLSYETMPREKDVHAAEVGLKSAETQYNQRFIIAQFDGMVTSVAAVKDYYVKKGDSAVRIDDKSRIFIPVSIPELDLNSISVGTVVSISVDAVSGRKYSGRVYTISDASESSGTTTAFNGMVLVDDPDERLLAGMTAEVSMPQNEKTDVILIPNAAITYADGNPTVTVVHGDVRQTVQIRLGTVTDSISEVISENLKEGWQLAVGSISESALTQLGLDPKDYLSDFDGMPPMDMRNGERPPFSGQPPAGFPERQPMSSDMTAVTPTAPMKEEIPAGSVSPTAIVSEKESENEKGTGENKPVPPQDENGQFPSFPGGFQMPPDGEGSFPAPPEGQFPGMGGDGQWPSRPPEGSFPGGDGQRPPRPPDGQFPGMGGDGQRPSGMPEGQRPPRDGNGPFPGRPEGSRPQGGDVTATPAPGSLSSEKG